MNTNIAAPIGLTAMTERLAARAARLWPTTAWGRVGGRQWLEEGALAAGARAGIPVTGMFPLAVHSAVITWTVVTLDTWVKRGEYHQEDKVVATFLREEDARAFLEAGLRDGTLRAPYIGQGSEGGIPPQAKCLRTIRRHEKTARRMVRYAEGTDKALLVWMRGKARAERAKAEAAAAAEGYILPTWEWLPQT